MTTPPTKVLTACVPLPLAEQIDAMAERERLTREALSDVDTGHVVDHQAVQAWADSLDTDTPLPTPRSNAGGTEYQRAP
ncbi:MULTISPECIES: CopG family transcriptional regulator [Burkholderia]|uniref:CopG family transcriptional regulator n=1 Tax=Burkholderia TaxID=32008 RepID=UPI0010536441|nr:CopG family transcriptional regulator [Burkholderia pyrrocinia]TDA47343.1 CopG family transcriptional regulator [Burkholderia pyrrocinia]UOB57970.1 CopG family transcriptional regulator [Burkholderia pyrrocinia]